MTEMIPQGADASRRPTRRAAGCADADGRRPGSRARRPGRMPWWGWAGLASMAIFEVLLFTTHGTLVGWFFTPVQWTGLILFLDGWRTRRRGWSLIADYPVEFALLGVISIGSWLVFEGYNLLLHNWRYLNLPRNLLVRYAGYAWAFATISPGMFLIVETLDDLLPGRDAAVRPRLGRARLTGFVAFGAACLVVPLAWPSPWMTPLVWMGFAFFLDPILGHRFDERSILAEFFTGRRRSMPIWFLAGLVAGLLWEFWNYWALARWEYHVPYWGHVKLFEMPVAGFLGFMPFTIESYAIYRFVRRAIPVPDRLHYLDPVRSPEAPR